MHAIRLVHVVVQAAQKILFRLVRPEGHKARDGFGEVGVYGGAGGGLEAF